MGKDTYYSGALFVDHATSYVHPEFQQVISSHATIMVKTLYKGMCRDHGVIPQMYLSDNGSTFSSKEFANYLTDFRQVIFFAGLGAHHHNGIAKHSIQTLMFLSCAMMLHAAIHWPDMADTKLWPAMTVQQLCFIWNYMSNTGTGLSPADIFTKIRWPKSTFHDTHIWVCPVYVLDKHIADGNKISKWKPRSHHCMNLGTAHVCLRGVPSSCLPATFLCLPLLFPPPLLY